MCMLKFVVAADLDLDGGTELYQYHVELAAAFGS